MDKKVITLFDLEKLWAEYLQTQDGKVHTIEHPMELSPAYISYCRRSWSAWTTQKEKRIYQLATLDMLETVLIDYYIETKPIRPI
jgi:hypothetical protein